MLKNILKKILSDKTKKIFRRILSPKIFYIVSSSTYPASNYHGFDRGNPIDRFYIDNFIKQNKKHIRGNCLELLNNDYTLKYGGEKIIKSDILDIDESNNRATIIDDLRNLKKIEDNSYECIILTQVLQFIDEVDLAISECHRILKKDGVILATLPAMSRIDPVSNTEGDYWRFTSASAKHIFQKRFSTDKIDISTHGNVRSGIFFYLGLSQEETSSKILRDNDPNFPLIITVKATK